MDKVPCGLGVKAWALFLGDTLVAPLELVQVAGVVRVEECRVLVGVVTVSEPVGELVGPLRPRT